MPTLRLTQDIEAENTYHIRLRYEDQAGGVVYPEAEARFTFALDPADYIDLRWYLEDYLQYPLDPAPAIAARIEARLRAVGGELFQKVFYANRDASNLWAEVRTKLAETRVEVSTDVAGAAALPWELLREPEADTVVALCARAFVRVHARPQAKIIVPGQAEQVRILLVICRPRQGEDVPFRSVAGRLLKGLRKEAAAQPCFTLEVLRPPTFEQLSQTLRQAKAAGQPYHIVHFDGHGGYFDAAPKGGGLSRQMFGGARPGKHGYLAFENPKLEENLEWVDGPSLGKLLVEAAVPVLVLNACRSARADPQEKPEADPNADPHAQVRAYGSLAQEVMDAGAAGVVAMRYNVYVVTAAQFVADLYGALAEGQALGEAVSRGRQQLAAQPRREIAFDPISLQDWSVPVVYEAAALKLLRRPEKAAPVKLDLSQNARADDGLPTPDAGFYGRDETLLALDRAFDRCAVVLLHAYAGSGKTMTAAEFARWYKETGGMEGPVLLTRFEQYTPLARVLDAVEETFAQLLQQNNIHWSALSDQERLNLTVNIFQQIPALWIWDNVEPVAGFPAGAQSAWSGAEQAQLKSFLQRLSTKGRVKFLLTSRRDETAWLGDLPARISLPAMPLQERVLLARALAEKRGLRLSAVDDWRPLLDFTQGNPLTLTVLVGQALRDGLKTKADVYAYVNRLRAGQAAFADEAGEGRTKSLGASLAYGFEQAFTESERRVLALLHCFQGFVDVDALRLMLTDEDWGLGVKDFTRAAGVALLDRAAEIGLLTALGGGYYTIHPALPWFFRTFFEQHYPATLPPFVAVPNGGRVAAGPGAAAAWRAYAEAMGELGNYYHDQYIDGNRGVIAPLRGEEANLLSARALARRHGWWGALTSTMQGLHQLYDHLGRRAEWRRLVEEVVPDFVGADDLPLPGREEQWSLVTQYRVLLAREARQWAAAERLQRVQVDEMRRRAAPLLARPPEGLDAGKKNTLRNLAASLHELGEIQRELGQPECVQAYEEAADLLHRIGDEPGAAVTAFNLGHAYTELPALRDLAAAERWYRRSLELTPEGDRLWRSKCLSQLGAVAYERFKDARQAQAPPATFAEHLNAALGFYHQALDFDPPDAIVGLAVDHNQLGNIYDDAGDQERALEHYNECIRYDEIAGNVYGAGVTRFNIALMFYQSGRLEDALLYARAALRNHEPFGQGAAQDIQKAQRLIAAIEEASTNA